MAKKGKPLPKTTQMIRVKKTVVEKVKKHKGPGQTMGGYVEHLINLHNGYSSTDKGSNA